MPRRPLFSLLAASLVLSLICTGPAEAAQVLLKNGRTVHGTLLVQPAGVTVTGTDGKGELLPFATIAGISLDDEPLYLPAVAHDEPKMSSESVLLWAMVATNVATMLLAGVALYRAANPARALP